MTADERQARLDRLRHRGAAEPHHPATPGQLAYLDMLGIERGEGVTRVEADALIEAHERRDWLRHEAATAQAA